MMKTGTIALSLLLLILTISISGCTAKETSKAPPPQDVYYILKNPSLLNGQDMTLRGTVIEWCITNSAMWMDGSFSDNSGEIPVIFINPGRDIHHCIDINYTREYVEYKATISFTIIQDEMRDNIGKSAGTVTYLRINNIKEQ